MNIDHIREAASVIQERLGGSATLGIVLGSGLGALADEVVTQYISLMGKFHISQQVVWWGMPEGSSPANSTVSRSL